MKPAWRRRCNPRWRRPMAGIADRRQRQLEGIAHDIRGPLTRLLLRVETLREQDSHDPELLAGLEADLMVLLALDQELLAISEPMTPARQRAWVPLAAVCRQTARSYGMQLVRVEIPEGLMAWVDRRLLQRTLHNLIENALEHGGPPVLITARTGEACTLIQLEDTGRTGPAIPPPLPRLLPAHKGLGLQAARRFCRSHGGELRLGASERGGWQVQLTLDPGPTHPPRP